MKSLVPILVLLLACASTSAAADNHDPSADARIDALLREAIFKRPELAGDEVSVQTRDGVVYLHGLVDTNVERATVERIARDTPGVTRVVNAIELRNRVR